MTGVLYLYTTSGCHLCEQAEQLLLPVLMHVSRLREDTGLAPLVLQHVEIAEDSALVERYGVRIPVLAVQGAAEELGWPFDQGDVFNYLNTVGR